MKCDRPGCNSVSTSTSRGTSITLPKGWLCLFDGEKATIACGEACFDVLWEQRAWRAGRRGVLEELPVPEGKLPP